MFSNLRGWEPIILVLLVVLLFGAKRLPDAARGLGRSLRIFKAETKGLSDSSGDAAGAKPVEGAAVPDAQVTDAPVTDPTPGKQTPTQT